MSKIHKTQSMWVDKNIIPILQKPSLDLNTIEASLAGPKRPQDKIFSKMYLMNFKKKQNIIRTK